MSKLIALLHEFKDQNSISLDAAVWAPKRMRPCWSEGGCAPNRSLPGRLPNRSARRLLLRRRLGRQEEAPIGSPAGHFWDKNGCRIHFTHRGSQLDGMEVDRHIGCLLPAIDSLSPKPRWTVQLSYVKDPLKYFEGAVIQSDAAVSLKVQMAHIFLLDHDYQVG